MRRHGTSSSNRYGRMIYRWCRRYRLQEADAEDVTQNVLLILAAQMKKFTYDPTSSFRGWLKTITYRSWCQFSRDRTKPGAGVGGDQNLDQLCSAEAGADFVQLLEREGDRELLEKAMALVASCPAAHLGSLSPVGARRPEWNRNG